MTFYLQTTTGHFFMLDFLSLNVKRPTLDVISALGHLAFNFCVKIWLTNKLLSNVRYQVGRNKSHLQIKNQTYDLQPIMLRFKYNLLFIILINFVHVHTIFLEFYFSSVLHPPT